MKKTISVGLLLGLLFMGAPMSFAAEASDAGAKAKMGASGDAADTAAVGATETGLSPVAIGVLAVAGTVVLVAVASSGGGDSSGHSGDSSSGH